MEAKSGDKGLWRQGPRDQELELLEKLGRRWGVLTALVMDLSKKGIEVNPEAKNILKTLKTQIVSGAFPVCDMALSIGRAEAMIMVCAAPLGDEYLREWDDYLVRSMKDEPMGVDEVKRIPFLDRIYKECEFLRCF